MLDAFDAIYEMLSDLHQRQRDLEARIERMFRKGQVTDVDPTKHLYRQQIGVDDSGKPVKSPWLPYSQRAGGRKEHSAPTPGEQYLLVNPDGSPDFTQGIGFPHGWWSANPSPSTDGAADVFTRGSTNDTTTASSRTITVGGSSITMTDGVVTITANSIKLNGNVDVNN